MTWYVRVTERPVEEAPADAKLGKYLGVAALALLVGILAGKSIGGGGGVHE